MSSTPTPQAPAPDHASEQPSSMDRFFDSIRGLGVVRAAEDTAPGTRIRWHGGVCTGLAQRFGIRVGMAQLLMVLTLLFMGPLVYGALWLLLPDREGRILAQTAIRGSVNASTLFASLLALIGLGSAVSSPVDWTLGGNKDHGGFPIGLLLMVGFGFVIFRQIRRNEASGRGDLGQTPSPTVQYQAPSWEPSAVQDAPYSPAARSAEIPASYPDPQPVANRLGFRGTLQGLSIAAIVGMFTWLGMRASGSNDVDSLSLGAAAAAFMAGCVLIATGLRGRRGGVLSLAAIGFLMISMFTPKGLHLNAPVFDDVNATVTEQQSQDYSTGLGDVRLTFPTAAPTSGSSPRIVKVNAGLGDVNVTVPDTVAVSVSVKSGVGDVNVNNQTRMNQNAPIRVGRAVGPIDYTLTINAGAGDVTVKQVNP